MGNSNKKSNIIIVGLDNSGKSTMINFLKPQKQQKQELAATIGKENEAFSKNKVNFTAFDMSGQGRYRTLWEKYYAQSEAIIFVIDSADDLRFAVAQNELEMLLQHEDIRDRQLPMLFFANKMDLPNAHSQQEIATQLRLEQITDRPWVIFPSNAIDGSGVNEGINWLTEIIKRNK